jgi:hypothetical protein
MMKRQGTVQNFTLTASSQLSSAFGAQTYRVRLAISSTGIGMGGAYILFGDSTSITASSTNGSLLPAPWSETFDVTPGQWVALIESSTAHGTLSVTELT